MSVSSPGISDSSSCSSSSLNEKLMRYKHLDDHEYYQKKRSRHNATKKFILIMQSIKDDRYSSFVVNNDSQANNDVRQVKDNYNYETSDLDEETAVNDFPDFNQILKRHGKRYKQQNSTLHH